MRKITVKAKIEITEEGAKQEAIFKDTKESAGYLAGWSGDYLAVRLNGEKKRFSKMKDAKNFLETQEVEVELDEMAELKRMFENNESFIIRK